MLLLAACSAQNAEMPTDRWDVVVISDSSLWELGDALAAQIEKDVGVEVNLESFSIGGLSAGSVLEALQGDTDNYRLETLHTALQEAEMVVMHVNPEDSVDPENPLKMGGCFSYNPSESCGPETFEKYILDLIAIWQWIFELRGDQPIILRATDLYNPLVSTWKERGVFEACTGCWENLSAANRQAAETFGIPFLSGLDAFNGPSQEEDPREKGYNPIPPQ